MYERVVFVLLTVFVRVWRAQHGQFDKVYQYSDEVLSGQSHIQIYSNLADSISYGELSFFNNFVTSYSINDSKIYHSKGNSDTLSLVKWLRICLLLCGDVHPCPGPGEQKYNNFRKRGLHFVHLNIRSLEPKIDELRLLAKNTNAACIMISETHLDNSIFDNEISIDGYVIQRKDRNRYGGGVCAYIRKDIAFNTRPDLSNEDMEGLFIDILLPKTKPILCGVIYRRPTQYNFYDVLETTLSASESFTNSETIILGDFNTDVCPRNKHPLRKKLLSICDMFSFDQVIKDFTRICSTTATIIDLILVSDSDKISQSGVIDSGISDHNIIYCTRKGSRDCIGKHNSATFRSLKNYSKESFHQSLLGSDWSPVTLSDNPNDAWHSFKSIFISCLDNVAPVRTVRIKQRSEEWVDSEVLECIKARDKAYHKFKSDKSEENFQIFRKLRNKANSTIVNAKKTFFKSSLENNKNDSKSLWKCLKGLGLPSKRGQTSSNIGLNVDGNIIFDKSIVSEKFNSFYTSVADKLVSKLPSCLNIFGSNFVFNYYSSKGVKPDSFSFYIVSESKILKYLNSLSPNKATGLDGVPSRFIKDCASIIAGPLSHIINLSIIQGSVPDDLKSARVVPLYKKNDKTDVGNYRPVSILSVVSKVLERVIYDQLDQYLSQNSILYEFQSGFRQGFSTDTCLIHLTDYIRFQMDKGQLVGMVLLDLQKAFDTVNHPILLMKLKAIGLSESSIRWFTSYLSDRRQTVDLSGSFSPMSRISCGVPQGSILGPLLFLVYVNDMPAAVTNKLLLYADDSGILVSAKSKQEIEVLLSHDLNRLSQWLICNKLSLHLGKTESILFGSRQRLKSQTQLDISCNGQSIQSTKAVKYLGATIDQNLSFDSMASSVIHKSNSRLKFLYRKSKFLTGHTKRLLVNSLIQCHFDYASSAWFLGLSQQLKGKLQVAQNRLVRFILGLPPRSHIGREELTSVGWLPVKDKVNLTILTHVHKVNSNTAPLYLHEHFSPASCVHKHPTRFRVKAASYNDREYAMVDSKRYSLPPVKGCGMKSFAYHGCSLWNSLPQDIRDTHSPSVFKHKVKAHLLKLVKL